LLALPFLPALVVPAVERDSPKLTFFFIAIIAAIAVKSAYSWASPAPVEPPHAGAAVAPASVPERPRRERAAKIAAGIALCAIWFGYGTLFSFLSVVNHHVLNSRTIDLGYYDNIFYQSAHGHPLACSLLKGGTHSSAHFDPLLVLLSPLYLLFPRAEFLLV